MKTDLILQSGPWRAALRPAVGGAIAGLWRDGEAVLRPAAASACEPLEMASFPLLPYANRIADARFAFAGATHQLARNFGDHPHSLHGVGWQRPWAVERADAASADLAHHHSADADWPFAYAARQQIRLDADGLWVKLAITNHATQPMPAGLGQHPYFPATAATTLATGVEGCWLSGPTLLPERRADPAHFANWSAGAPVQQGQLIDHAHDGWNAEALITQPWGRVRLVAEGARALHLYSPPGGDFFCAEPVSHLPDAFNRTAFPFDILAPGETLTLTMRIEARPT